MEASLPPRSPDCALPPRAPKAAPTYIGRVSVVTLPPDQSARKPAQSPPETANRRAFITGITGQDGRHLAELLHGKGYEVFGLVRGQKNPRRGEVESSQPYVRLIEGDLTDLSSLFRALEQSAPDEIYNLGAVSHVGYSFAN